MLESFRGDNFTYQKISPEEQQRRGILGRLMGVIADTVNPTRNGRKYGANLWEKVFSDPIVREKIENRVFFGELEHPIDDRESIDPEKIAICLAEVPKKNDKGQLVGVFDVLDTPCGRILKTMLDYGTTIGVSTRGSGDLYTDYDGQEAVDPDTYQCFAIDAVAVPSVQAARMRPVNESLENNGRTLKEALQNLVESASDADKEVMQKTIDEILSDKENSKSEGDKKGSPEDEGSEKKKEDDTSEKSKKEPIKATVKEEKKSKEFKQDLDINHIMSLSKDDDSSIDKTPDGCMINLRGKDLKNSKLIDYLDSLSCATLDDSVSDSTVRGYKCRCNFDFMGESYENLKGKTLTVVYEDENGEEKETHFECDKNYDINGQQIRSAIKASDRDIKKIIALHESLNKENVNSICDQILTAVEGVSLSIEDFNAVVKCLYKTLSPENDDEDMDYEFVEPLQKIDNNNAPEEVDNVKSDDSEIINALQDSLEQKHSLESKVVELQEKLSVCYAKESLIDEQLSKYKKAVRNLTTKANMVPALNERVSKLSENLDIANKSLNEQRVKNSELEETINSTRAKASKLNESMTSTARELSSLNETYRERENELNETIQQLNEQLETQRETYDNQLETSTKLVEKYKKIANNAVNKYVESKAVQIGVSANEIKNKLPESYNFEDINQICEDLQQQKMNLNKLPFRTSNLNENVKVSVKTTCKPDNILPKDNPTTDDSIDSWLGQFLGR